MDNAATARQIKTTITQIEYYPIYYHLTVYSHHKRSSSLPVAPSAHHGARSAKDTAGQLCSGPRWPVVRCAKLLASGRPDDCGAAEAHFPTDRLVGSQLMNVPRGYELCVSVTWLFYLNVRQHPLPIVHRSMAGRETASAMQQVLISLVASRRAAL